MADSFGNDNLSPPERMYAPYGQGGSGNDVVGGVLNGLANIGSLYFKKAGEEARAQGGNDLSKQITDVILDKASTNGAPPLVGQGTGDSAHDAGAASPTG